MSVWLHVWPCSDIPLLCRFIKYFIRQKGCSLVTGTVTSPLCLGLSKNSISQECNRRIAEPEKSKTLEGCPAVNSYPQIPTLKKRRTLTMLTMNLLNRFHLTVCSDSFKTCTLSLSMMLSLVSLLGRCLANHGFPESLVHVC